jgi:hypothetical protein
MLTIAESICSDSLRPKQSITNVFNSCEARKKKTHWTYLLLNWICLKLMNYSKSRQFTLSISIMWKKDKDILMMLWWMVKFETINLAIMSTRAFWSFVVWGLLFDKLTFWQVDLIWGWLYLMFSVFRWWRGLRCCRPTARPDWSTPSPCTTTNPCVSAMQVRCYLAP